MFNPNQSIPIGAKVEIGPKGFTLRGVKTEIEKIFSICEANLNPCGQCRFVKSAY
jgi:hypothetical protein